MEQDIIHRGYYEMCPICGKMFQVGDRTGYVYKRIRNNHKKTKTVSYFCSWTCYRKDEKERAKRRTVHACGMD